jgi:hypothetical protein
MLRTYASDLRRPRRYLVIDGYDTVKILRHFRYLSRFTSRVTDSAATRSMTSTDLLAHTILGGVLVSLFWWSCSGNFRTRLRRSGGSKSW